MNVQVRFFAKAKDIVGADQATVELSGTPTIGNLRSTLGEQYHELQTMAASLLFAVGTDYVTDSAVLNSDSDVVCFPPVSGG